MLNKSLDESDGLTPIEKVLSLCIDGKTLILKSLSVDYKEHIFKSVLTMTEELGLDKIPDYKTRVKMRYDLIQKFPDTVFWDYAEYYNLEQFIDSKPEGIFKNTLVSSNGDYISINKERNRLYIYSNKPDKTKTFYKNIWLRGSKRQYRLHRVIASTFIPTPENTDIRKLITNHIDLDKRNNPVSNLEWCTQKENIHHAEKTRAELGLSSIPFLFEIAYGPLKGQKFILTRRQVKCLKMRASGIDECLRGRTKHYHGCLVKRIEKEEIDDYAIILTNEQLNFITGGYNKYIPTAIKPIIGEILIGEYKGIIFSLLGCAEVEKYFSHTSVLRQIRGETESYRGCKFRYDTIENALPYRFKMTKEIAEVLKTKTKRIKK